MARIFISLVLAALTAVCIYSAHISGKVQNAQGVWLFYAFSLFFAVPLTIIIIKALGQKNAGFRKVYDKLSGRQEETTRLVPHWAMMFIIFVFAAIVIINILGFVLRFIK